MENSKNMKNFKKKIIKNGKYFLKKHIEDIKEIAEKGKKKLKKAKNMIQERKKEENVAYTFQPQDNKKYHDKIKKDFHEKQEESLEFNNPIEYWHNICFSIKQLKEDIKNSTEKGRQKREKVKNMIQERKKEENINSGEQKIKEDKKYFLEKHMKDIKEIAEKYRQKLEKVKNMIQERKKEENIKDYTSKPQFLKPFRRIRLKSSNNKDSYLQIYQNKVFNKKNKLQKKRQTDNKKAHIADKRRKLLP